MKVLVFLGVVLGVFIVARMGAASALKPPGGRIRAKPDRPEAPRAAQELLPCPRCGAYVAPGDACSCAERK